MATNTLPIPSHFDENSVGDVWRVPYGDRAAEARDWARHYNIKPAAKDSLVTLLLLIDEMNTFCVPGFELFVGGRSGRGAVDDNVRLIRWAYQNMHRITKIHATLDTHTAMQIFHEVMLIDENGNHPTPFTDIHVDDVLNGHWKINPAVANDLSNGNYVWLNKHLEHYVKMLKQAGKYSLTIWPYHAILGGIGHALVAAVEEMCWFHNHARSSQTGFQIKGGNPMTENYSILRPEVMDSWDKRTIAQKNTGFIKQLISCDRLIIAGQAKSHCVAWTIDDLLNEILANDPSLAHKVYLLEDCSSAVVVPGVVDHTDAADASFRRFAQAGMHLVKSTDDMDQWPS